MNYASPELRRALCSQYVLGTLQGPARRRFEHLLPADGALRTELHWWEERLAQLALRLKPLPPRETVWLGLQRQIARGQPTAIGVAKRSGPDVVRPWQGLAWIAMAASVVLATALFLGPEAPSPTQIAVVPAGPTYVAMLQPKEQPSAWQVTVQPKAGRMKVKVLQPYPTDAQHDVELWVIAGGKPVSVGVIPRSGETTFAWPKDVPFAEKLVLAVSFEPAGGSPTGQPTGPVLATGEIRQI